jgi:hypothetical protein
MPARSCRQVRAGQRHCDRAPLQCQGMPNLTGLASAPSHPLAPFTDRLRLAVACLAASRAPPATAPNPTSAATSPGARNAAWTRWPPSGRTWICTSGGCRRSAGSSPPPSPGGSQVASGFYRTCVRDGVLEHSPAGHVRRPWVPAESPALGFTHLQFEASTCPDCCVPCHTASWCAGRRGGRQSGHRAATRTTS